MSSAPVLTDYNFDWSVSEVGVLMAVLGLLVLPVNVVVGRMSLVYEDRRVFVFVHVFVDCLFVCCCSCLR